MLLLSCFLWVACQPKSITQPSLQSYKVGTIPQFNSFQTLNEAEQQYVTSMPNDNALTGASAFKTNRSRIFFDHVIKNGAIEKQDSTALKSISIPCNCILKEDTLHLNTGIGMMGGFGFNLKIHKKKAFSEFYMYTDDIKPYKSSLADTAFQRYALVANQKSNPILEEQPQFVLAEQLNGLLSFKTLPIYERTFIKEENDKLYSRTIEGRVFFTCKVRKKLLWER